MKKTFEITKMETLTALLQAFPRTFEAKRLIGDGEVWRVSVDPEAEEDAEAKATSVVMDDKTGEILGAFNPYFGWFPFPKAEDKERLDHLAELVAIADDPFRFMGTQTGRTSSKTPNESNPPKAEEYGVHKDAVDCWAATDFDGLERRVNQLRNAKDRFKKNKGKDKDKDKDRFQKNPCPSCGGWHEYGAADPATEAATAEDVEELLEAMVDKLAVMQGKVDACGDNTEDNLGRVRTLEAKTQDRVNELFKMMEHLRGMVNKLGASKHDAGGWSGEQLDAMGEQVNRLTRGLEAVKADVVLVNNRIDERESYEAEQREMN